MAAFGLSGILFLQFAIGAVDVLLLAPTWCQLLHLLAADLFGIGLVTATAPAVFQSESVGQASYSVKRSPVKA
jgi:heme a synthase